MRLCFVGKFPPIQGGVSRINFWDAHALSGLGHEVHVVTNAPEVEEPYRIDERFYAGQPGDDPRGRPGLTVHAPSGRRLHHIPYATPYVSRLAGLTAYVASETACDLIYGFYLEPYGVAAHLASRWTGIPYGLRHAGSDVGRLGRDRDLGITYTAIAQDADFWLDISVAMRRGWRLRGVNPDDFHTIGRYSLPTDYFRPDATPMRLAELGRFDPAAPTIGMYGKLGEVKGTFDLLAAFAKARGAAGRGNLVLVSSGPVTELERFRAMAGELGVEPLILPFMPHWKVPSFLAACDAVAFLERDFPIDIHRPTVPREILACGRCLIVSEEVADYQSYAHLLDDGVNHLRADPHDTEALAALIEPILRDPARAREIGRNGYEQISRQIENWPEYVNELGRTFEDIQHATRERRTIMSVAEMQAAFARLSVDDAFRHWFELAPEAALSRYGLTDQERESLSSVNHKMLALFAETLKDKRRSKVLSFFPLSMGVGEELVRRYFDRFYDLRPVEPGAGVPELAGGSAAT